MKVCKRDLIFWVAVAFIMYVIFTSCSSTRGVGGSRGLVGSSLFEQQYYNWKDRNDSAARARKSEMRELEEKYEKRRRQNPLVEVRDGLYYTVGVPGALVGGAVGAVGVGAVIGAGALTYGALYSAGSVLVGTKHLAKGLVRTAVTGVVAPPILMARRYKKRKNETRVSPETTQESTLGSLSNHSPLEHRVPEPSVGQGPR